MRKVPRRVYAEPLTSKPIMIYGDATQDDMSTYIIVAQQSDLFFSGRHLANFVSL